MSCLFTRQCVHIDLSLAYENCCGIPLLHNGDLDDAVAAAEHNVAYLVGFVEDCSGHDGTWAMKKENFEMSLKYGGRAFKEMAESDPKVTCSDCLLAEIQIEQANGIRPLNPMQILAMSYRAEAIA